MCPPRCAGSFSLPGHVTAAHDICFLLTADNHVTSVTSVRRLVPDKHSLSFGGTGIFPTVALMLCLSRLFWAGLPSRPTRAETGIADV